MTWVGPKSNDKCLIRDREDAAAGPVTRWPPGAGRGRSGLSPGAWVWGGAATLRSDVRPPALWCCVTAAVPGGRHGS